MAEREDIISGLKFGVGVGACAIGGYLIYKYFFEKEKSPMIEWLEREAMATAADISEETDKIRKGEEITDKDVEIIESIYLPKLEYTNEELQSIGVSPIELPPKYETMSNEEKVLYLKNATHSALRNLAWWYNPPWYKQLWEGLLSFGVWVLLPAGTLLLFWKGKIPEFVRKIKKISPPKRTKIFNVLDHNNNSINFKAEIDGVLYTSDYPGNLELPLKHGNHVINIFAEGFKRITDIIEIVPGTDPVINRYTLDPIPNPMTGEPLPDEDPQDIVDTTPISILSLIAAMLGTTVKWMQEHPLETATIIGVTAALAFTLLTPLPGDEAACAMWASSVFAGMGLNVGWLDLITNMPSDVVKYFGGGV
ncbi:MAG: hypothetical protein OCU22_03690 [Canidatus Methanoxibalbensis ujae]|nr:hypothetical protein [Candidatus Methanoxibalbensis ujae]